MDPNLILNEEEKRERFQNYFKKKDEEERLKQEQKEKEFSLAKAKIKTQPRSILPK